MLLHDVVIGNMALVWLTKTNPIVHANLAAPHLLALGWSRLGFETGCPSMWCEWKKKGRERAMVE